MRKYTSWSIEIELRELSSGYIMTLESIKGFKEYALKNTDEIINTVIEVCRVHDFGPKKASEILDVLNVEHDKLKLFKKY